MFSPHDLPKLWQATSQAWLAWWGIAGWWPKAAAWTPHKRQAIWQKWTTWVGQVLKDSKHWLWQMANQRPPQPAGPVPEAQDLRQRWLRPQEQPVGRGQATMDHYLQAQQGPVPRGSTDPPQGSQRGPRAHSQRVEQPEEVEHTPPPWQRRWLNPPGEAPSQPRNWEELEEDPAPPPWQHP